MSEAILETIRKLVAGQLSIEIDDVRPESSFQDDLGADSLDLVEIMLSLEDEFSIKIDDEVAQTIKTVQDALDFITKHQG